VFSGYSSCQFISIKLEHISDLISGYGIIFPTTGRIFGYTLNAAVSFLALCYLQWNVLLSNRQLKYN